MALPERWTLAHALRELQDGSGGISISKDLTERLIKLAELQEEQVEAGRRLVTELQQLIPRAHSAQAGIKSPGV